MGLSFGAKLAKIIAVSCFICSSALPLKLVNRDFNGLNHDPHWVSKRVSAFERHVLAEYVSSDILQ